MPNIESKYIEHDILNNELLAHVFFEDDVCCEIRDIAIQQDELKLKQIFDLIELALSEGDAYLQEVIIITILAGIGDDKKVLSNSRQYMGKNTIIKSNEVEKYWGRI
nr:hypothetical protein [Terrisporobacter mayombei]